MSGVRLYRQLLGVEAPWEVREVELKHDGADAPGWGGLGLPSGEVVVHMEYVGEALCPKCFAGVREA